MIEQYLLNTNKNPSVPILQKILQLKKAWRLSAIRNKEDRHKS
jgi:hypothetical protein